MKKHIAYVGLDVHKDSIAVAVAEETGEARYWGPIPNREDSLERVIRQLQKRYESIEVAYEAGPCGYGIYRTLRSKGVRCHVVAPSLIPRRPGDRVKTDRRDAVTLARLLRAGELTAVYVPVPEDEAVRDLLRTRESAVKDRTRWLQRLSGFLQRQGRIYRGTKKWTPRYREWVRGQRFEQAAHQVAYEEMVKAVEEADERVARLTRAVREEVEGWRMAPVVKALQAFRGIRLVVAATIVAEVGDLTRFESARQLMSFLGLVPSEHSSGGKQRRGRVTKMGNAHVRRVLGEAVWLYRLEPKKSRAVAARQRGVAAEVVEVAWKAQERLHARYVGMRARGKPKGVTVIAMARELVGFLWAAFHAIPMPAGG